MASKRALKRKVERHRAYRERWQKCGRKYSHPDEEAALKVIEVLRAMGKAREDDGKVLHAYQCEACGGKWHVGHHRPEATP